MTRKDRSGRRALTNSVPATFGDVIPETPCFTGTLCYSRVMDTGSPTAIAIAAPPSRVWPYLALAGSMLSFCIGTSFAKQLFPLIGAPGAIAYRVGFSALVLLAIFRPWRGALTRADLLATMRYGAALGLMNFSFYMALRTIPLGIAIAIEFLGPLTVSLIHSRRPAHFAMVGLAAAGLAMLLPLGRINHALDPVGLGFALGAGLFWGLYIVFGKRTGHLPSGQAVALGMATAALIVVPVGIYSAGSLLLSPAFAAIGVMIAILSSAIPYSLDMIALKNIPANRFGVLLSVEPAIGAISGWLLLAEHLTALQCTAIGLVVAASIGSVVMV